MAKLSENFDLEEFLFSETAARMGREIVPTARQIEELRRLCVLVLEPIRARLGNRRIRITSGLRPDWLNTLIGGSQSSEHRLARAADFLVPEVSVIEVSAAAADLVPSLPVNQLIHEFDAWTHVSVCAVDQVPKRQVLTARRIGGATRYLDGIVPKAAA